MSDLHWNTELINSDRFRWVAFLVCPDCGGIWRGVLPGERPGAEGAIEQQCPDCEDDDDES